MTGKAPGHAMVVAALLLAARASASPVLTPLQVLQEINLTDATAVVVSPDGAHVYATASSGDALARYARQPDGTLVFSEILRDGIGGIEALDGATAVVMSADGAYLYVAARDDDAVAVFARNAGDGALTTLGSVTTTSRPRALALSPGGEHLYVGTGEPQVEVFTRNGVTGALAFAGAVTVDEGVRGIAVSPGGEHVYVATWNGSVFDLHGSLRVFARNPGTGMLAFTQLASFERYWEGVVVSPDGAHVYATRGGATVSWQRNAGTGHLTQIDIDGFVDGEAAAIAMDAAGTHVYVAYRRLDGLDVFARDALTGELVPVDGERDGVGGVDGLDGAQGLALSPDGATVYVAARADAAIAVLARDAMLGTVTFTEANRDAGAGVAVLRDPRLPVMTPDGRHVYVDTAGGIVVFDRNAGDGTLSPGPVVVPGASAGDIDVSPDGAHVYLLVTPTAIDVYARDALSGALTAVETESIADASSIAISPDGAHLYTGGGAVLARNGLTGALSPAGTFAGGGSSCEVTPDGAHVLFGYYQGLDVWMRNAATGALTFLQRITNDSPEIDDTLDGTIVVAPSGDGRHVYALSPGGSTSPMALNAFRREAGSGRLRLVSAVEDFLHPIFTTVATRQLLLDPHGAYVFAMSTNDELAAFARDPGTGRPRLLAVEHDDVNGFRGLEEPFAVVDPDGLALYVTSVADDTLTVLAIDPCGIAVAPKLQLSKVNTDGVPGNDGLKLVADAVLRRTTFADLDPQATGARVVVTAADGTTRVDVTLPGGAFGGGGTAGWKQNGAGTTWTFVDATGAPANGITSVKLQDRASVAPSRLRMKLKGRNGTYPVVAGDEPVTMAVELGSATRCVSVPFGAGECAFPGAGNRLSCRGD